MVRMSNPHPEAPRVSCNESETPFGVSSKRGRILPTGPKSRAHWGSRIVDAPEPSMPKPIAKTEPESAQTSSTLSYEAAVAELEQLVAAMETGQMPLDRLLEGYKRGAELLALCRSRLKAVEEQVQVLEDGHLRALEAGNG